MRRRREKVELTGDEEQIVSSSWEMRPSASRSPRSVRSGRSRTSPDPKDAPFHRKGAEPCGSDSTTMIDLKKRLNIVIEGDMGITSASRIIIAEIGDAQLG